MLNPPRTKKAASKLTYGKWSSECGWEEGRCAYKVWGWMTHYQCTRKSGHGPAGLYCKQHAKMVK